MVDKPKVEHLKELTKSSMLIILGYADTMDDISKNYKIPRDELDKIMVKNIKKWRKMIEE